jgi:adenosylcobinamide amidohydrolase
MSSPFQLDGGPDCLVIRFSQVFGCRSWAPWNGGEISAFAVVNRHVDLHGLSSFDTIAEDFRSLFKNGSLVPDETIGLMTAAKVQGFTECFLMSFGACGGDRWAYQCSLGS